MLRLGPELHFSNFLDLSSVLVSYPEEGFTMKQSSTKKKGMLDLFLPLDIPLLQCLQQLMLCALWRYKDSQT